MSRQATAATNRRWLMTTFACAAIAVLTETVHPRLAVAQRPTETFHACYSPPSGVVYRIREQGVPRKCVDADDVEFSWTSGGQAAGGQSGGGGAGAGGAAPTVPAGAVVFFETASCPSGWSPFDEARGRVIVGVGSGGLLAGTVGVPLADLEDREHTHGLAAVDLTSSNSGEHSHATPEQAFESSGDGMHNHIWAKKTSGSGSGANLAWYDGNGKQLINWGDGVGNEGSGHYPISTSEWGSLTLYTSMGGLHSHSVNVPALTSTDSGGHTHTVSFPDRVTTPASTSDVVPYVQLLACLKS